MKCQHCGCEVSQDFDKCPVCGAPASPQYTSYQPPNPYLYPPQKRRSGGEIASMVTAIIVAAISPIIAIIVFYATLIGRTYEYASDLSDYDDYSYSSGYFDYSYGNFNSPEVAPKNKPVEFEEELYSFSNGYVKTTYEVTMEETYRGDAAIKLMGDAKIPELNSMQEIFVVKFNIEITEQDTPAYVTLTSLSASASNLDASICQSLSLINYKDNTQLLMEGESGTRWMAFVIDKDAENPIIWWYGDSKYEFFRNSEESISDPSAVVEGDAVESRSTDDDTSSDE